MTDQLGWRAIFGVLTPSTNTIVETDYNRMLVPGVTSAVGRIHLRTQDLSSDAAFENLLREIRDETESALERLLTAEPDHLVMGMSAETFWGGLDGSREFQERIEDLAQMPVYSGATACQQALQIFGAEHIAVVTPYQPEADRNVRSFFEESGFDVVRLTGLRRPSARAIAGTPTDLLRATLQEIDGDDVQAIVQVGTNLSMVGLADEAERWLGKPVIAINAATWWSALRGAGFDDRLQGFGSLLREH
ncbi:MAG: hypothetical protein ABW004_09045 [Aeromicrobium sp.]